MAEDGTAQRLRLVPADAPAGAVASLEGTAALGEAAVEDGWLRYQPHADAHGVEVLAYRLCADGRCTDGTVQVTVAAVEDPPLLRADRWRVDTYAEVVLDVLANDRDADGDELAVVVVGGASRGTTRLVGGRVHYQAALGYRGPVSFSYTATDGTSRASTTVELDLDPPDLAPVAARDAALGTPAGAPLSLDVTTLVEDPDGGPVEVLAVRPARFGSAVLEAPGRVRYEPAAATTGYDRFEVVVAGEAGSALTSTVTVTVTPRAGAPALRWSTAADRSGHQAAGGELAIDRPVALFVAPEDGVVVATFYLDDPLGAADPLRVEVLPPFDLGATAPDGTAHLVTPGALGAGEHLLTVVAERSGGERPTMHHRLLVS
jgi:hypothetical protein